MKKKQTVGISVVGVGYWGPNFVRNLSILPTAEIRFVCDIDPIQLKKIKQRYPSIQTTRSYKDVLDDKKTQGIIIATPVRTHFNLAKQALEANKHVLVEKPMTANSQDAETLVELAKRKNKILLVDHTFIYHPAVQKIKQLVIKKELGQLLYFDSVRTNLGLFQNDTNVLWDLATHDLSIMDYLLDANPKEIIAIGASHIRKDIENVVYVTVRYAGNLLGHIHVNWLAPVKIRNILLSGYKKMIAYNDMEPIEKIKIYDRSIKYKENTENISLSKYRYRVGNIESPHIDDEEALQILCRHFINCILEKEKPLTDGNQGLRIVKMLEAAQQSLKSDGKPVQLSL
ncbi:MAG: Gfo/Idh/MocA family oxidoreductase [Patescibacteria group bacterium]|nr:Gfo/Idh/MocA family oxidoreductase [Patescibacteria group bacterium]